MATSQVGPTVVGVFETRAQAEDAIAGLRAAGYRDDRIGLVAQDRAGNPVRTTGSGETYAEGGAAAGAAAGAAVGAAIGAGILAGVIPVVGPVLAVGPLAAVLLNAAGGAAVAGIAGALIGWGIPEPDARFYEEQVKTGRYLVTVEAGGRADDARVVLAKNGGYDRASAVAAG